RFDVAMDYAALVRVRKSGANLLQIKQGAIQAQRLTTAERGHVTAAQVFEYDVMKSRAIQIDRRTVSQTTDGVRMADAVQSNRFVLKVLNESAFEFGVLVTLKQHVEGFDYHLTKPLVRRAAVARNVNFSVAPATETLFDVVARIEPAPQ